MIDQSHRPTMSLPEHAVTMPSSESDSQASISPSILENANCAADAAAFIDSPQSPGPKQQAAFVSKLYQMVSDPSSDHLIKWTPMGDSFLVLRPEDFAKGLCSLFFKHNNWQSFVRQLNMYQFHKVNDVFHSNSSTPGAPTAWEFKHASFKRGRVELLAGIKRKASKPASQREVYNTQAPRETYRPYSSGSNEDSATQEQNLAMSGLMQHITQRITPIEESQRILMNQNLAMLSALNSYQNILQGMANVLASNHPSQSTQAIQQDIFALSQHLYQAQHPQRPAISAHSSYTKSTNGSQPHWLNSPNLNPRSPSHPPIMSPSDYTPAPAQNEPDSYFRVPLHQGHHTTSRPATPAASSTHQSTIARPPLQVHASPSQILTPPLSDISGASRTSSTSNVRESFARDQHLPSVKHHFKLHDQISPPIPSSGPTSNAVQRPFLDRGRSLQSLLNDRAVSEDIDHEDRKRRRTTPQPELPAMNL